MAAKIVYSITATSINIAGGLLRNKIFAAFLSINLFGILSIGQQSVGLLFTFFAFGLPLGITTLSSQLLNRTEEERVTAISRIVVLTIGLAGVFSVGLAAAVFLDPYFISRLITSKTDYALPVSILLFSSPLMVIETCLFAIMEGMGKLKEIVVFKIIPTAISLPIMYFLVSEYQLLGAAVGLVVSEFIIVLTAFILLRKLITVNKRAFQVSSVFVEVARVAVLSFLVGVGWLASDFLVKRYMLELLGEVNNGIIQSVAKVTDMYPSIALSWLSMHLFPVIAVAGADKQASSRVLHRTVFVAVSMIVPIILVLFALRSFVLEVLYKKEFVIAVRYFGAMLATGILKVFAWVMGTALLPLGLKRQWFYSAVIFNVLYVAGVWFGLRFDFSIYAIPVALGIALLLQSLYTLYQLRVNGIQFNKTFWLQTAFFAVLSGAFIGSVLWTPLLLVVAVVYGVFVYVYELIDEVKTKLYEFGKKAIT